MGGRLLVVAAAGALASLFAATGLDAAPRHVAPAHRAAPPAHADWTRTIVATPEGVRMGNPNAPVKLVEYGSITCPHCALFSVEGGTALRQSYVKGGKVSWEYRPFMIFPTDPGIFMLLRCQGAAGFFPTSDRLYAGQKQWTAKLQALPPERIEQLQKMSVKDRVAALVEASGTDAYFRQRGMSQARIKACLADDRNLKALTGITEKASKAGVTGTPAFFINGFLNGAIDWAGLEPLLKSAGG
ncbi:MAG: protein-disulfide isomerase-like protein [Alphaproteobacteria bacterium]|nr:protein-disulfide isomerase-like protein [Alphaproteobacteria bacterium]